MTVEILNVSQFTKCYSFSTINKKNNNNNTKRILIGLIQSATYAQDTKGIISCRLINLISFWHKNTTKTLSQRRKKKQKKEKEKKKNLKNLFIIKQLSQV